MKTLIRRCDQCRAEMPVYYFELRSVLVLHVDVAEVERERSMRTEVCSEWCLTKAHAALVREVRNATAMEPSAAGECHAIAHNGRGA